ncbi:hypothetical protein Golob_027674, partial [Gossypium lobatum]|nr:hypothetical protein [Gossypium lobatum]
MEADIPKTQLWHEYLGTRPPYNRFKLIQKTRNDLHPSNQTSNTRLPWNPRFDTCKVGVAGSSSNMAKAIDNKKGNQNLTCCSFTNIYGNEIVAIENYTKGKMLTKATGFVDFNFPEDLNGANPFARIASYKVFGDKVTVDKSVEVLKNSLLDAMKKATLVNIGGYLEMKENVVVCTSSCNHGHDYYTLSGGLAPWVIE